MKEEGYWAEDDFFDRFFTYEWVFCLVLPWIVSIFLLVRFFGPLSVVLPAKMENLVFVVGVVLGYLFLLLLMSIYSTMMLLITMVIVASTHDWIPENSRRALWENLALYAWVPVAVLIGILVNHNDFNILRGAALGLFTPAGIWTGSYLLIFMAYRFCGGLRYHKSAPL